MTIVHRRRERRPESRLCASCPFPAFLRVRLCGDVTGVCRRDGDKGYLVSFRFQTLQEQSGMTRGAKLEGSGAFCAAGGGLVRRGSPTGTGRCVADPEDSPREAARGRAFCVLGWLTGSSP